MSDSDAQSLIEEAGVGSLYCESCRAFIPERRNCIHADCRAQPATEEMRLREAEKRTAKQSVAA